ncbi:MAG: hypothetical protein AAF572_00420 [Cyanobacteria bacterium P01_B01_bin.77]
MDSQVIYPMGLLPTYDTGEICMTLDGMTPNGVPTTLDLLVPWDIPLEYRLDPATKQQMQTSLQQLLEILKITDNACACSCTEQLLAELPRPNAQPAQVKSTKTSLSTDDAEDYDQFFGVRHIQTTEPALCLVRGLLTNCHRFLSLCVNHPQLSPQHIAQQKQGFVSYIDLLGRVFYLEELS